MVRSRMKITISRDSEDEASLKAHFKGRKFFGSVACIALSNTKRYFKLKSGHAFFVPYKGMIYREICKLKVDQSVVLEVFIDS